MVLKGGASDSVTILEGRIMPPTLGVTANEVLDAFRRIDQQNCGLRITEALAVGAGLRFRWQGSGKLGVVVGEIGIRDASDSEYAELEEAVELGQAEIYTTGLFVSGRARARNVLHQATGMPLDPNSAAARQQRARWARADAARRQPAAT